jgi:hypothetical protein
MYKILGQSKSMADISNIHHFPSQFIKSNLSSIPIPLCFSFSLGYTRRCTFTFLMIRIIMGCKNYHSCRSLFVNLKILPLPSQYIFLLLLFLNKNRKQFKTNSEICHCATRQQLNFHQPSVNLTKYQKVVYCQG